MNSKEENESIPLEVLKYLENVELDYKKIKTDYENVELENHKIKTEILPTMEKFVKKYQKLEVKTKELEERNLCKVCMEAEICFVFLPCGHLCTCENCAVNGNLKDCPICRVKIEKRNKTFIS